MMDNPFTAILNWLNKNSGALTVILAMISSVPLTNGIKRLLGKYRSRVKLDYDVDYIGTSKSGITVFRLQAETKNKEPIPLEYLGLAITHGRSYERIKLNHITQSGDVKNSRALCVTCANQEMISILKNCNRNAALCLLAITTTGKTYSKKVGSISAVLNRLESFEANHAQQLSY